MTHHPVVAKLHMSRLLILMYHQVDTPATEWEQRFCTPPMEFRRQMVWLKKAGYQMVDMDAVLAHVSGEHPLTEKAVHITFDDGFIGVLEHAWPVLQEFKIPATLYALPGRFGQTNDWMWQRGFPKRALLSSAQIRMLAEEGMTIGSHTCTHPRLTEIPNRQAEEEINKSKDEMEDLLGQSIEHFAYPYGLLNTLIRNLEEQAGYQSACSTRSAFNRTGEDPFMLRRIDVFGTDKLWQFRQKLTFGTNEASRLQPLAYYSNRLAARLGFQ